MPEIVQLRDVLCKTFESVHIGPETDLRGHCLSIQLLGQEGDYLLTCSAHTRSLGIAQIIGDLDHLVGAPILGVAHYTTCAARAVHLLLTTGPGRVLFVWEDAGVSRSSHTNSPSPKICLQRFVAEDYLTPPNDGLPSEWRRVCAAEDRT